MKDHNEDGWRLAIVMTAGVAATIVLLALLNTAIASAGYEEDYACVDNLIAEQEQMLTDMENEQFGTAMNQVEVIRATATLCLDEIAEMDVSNACDEAFKVVGFAMAAQGLAAADAIDLALNQSVGPVVDLMEMNFIFPFPSELIETACGM